MIIDINLWRSQIGQYHRICNRMIVKNSKCGQNCINVSLITLLSLACLLLIEIIHFYSLTISFDNPNISINHALYQSIINFFLHYFFIAHILLILSNDIARNPGPNKEQNLTICHWNIGSISVHNFQKLNSLQAFNSIHNFDLICISETFLDSSFSSDDPSLSLKGYDICRSDHPTNKKRGGVCIYYKKSLAFNLLTLGNLTECLVCEITFNNKKCFVISIYRSPSQNVEEFAIFIHELEHIINTISIPGNPNPIIIIGDFNAKLSTWNPSDPDSQEGIELASMTSLYGLTQMITDPTHILPNSSSCIDLLFTNQPNLISKKGIYSSLHPNCHHQIIYAEINFKICFPPPYERHIWHYNRANILAIRQSLESINWQREFDHKGVNKQVEILNNYLINVCQNYIPNEVIIIDDKDPPWITSNVRKKILVCNSLYKSFTINGRNVLDLEKFQESCKSLNDIISKSKNEYYNRIAIKLNDPKTSSKAYWSILKSFFGDKKIPVIPPILSNNQYVTDFKAKADLFNIYFSNQCSLLNNSSVLPLDINPILHPSLDTFNIESDQILKIIRSLDINKSHGYDNISARMLKICDSSIVKPLLMIFRNSLNEGVFPSLWKKGNITPIHKKGDKDNINNYRPISVLPLFGKLFEKLIYNALYKYLEDNHILDANQSGFRTGDSCINQLLSITHNIFQSFDANPSLEVRGVFLDISKAFDKVWHEGLLFKLRSIGIEGKFLDILKSFLYDRYQRVVLNGQSSSWKKINAGVPQGSILGPLLFLVYINDISKDLVSNVKLFADDTSIFSTVYDRNQSANAINSDLEKIQQWAYQWKMTFNPDHSKQAQEVIFSRKHNKEIHPNLYFNQSIIQVTSSQKHLGLILDEKLSFNSHLKVVIDKATKGISILRKLHHYVPRNCLITIYKSFIRSHLEYADVIYDQPNNNSLTTKIESLQYNAALAITGAIRGTSREKIYQELGLEYLSSRRWYKRLCLFYKIINNKSPAYLYNIIPKIRGFHNTRNSHLIPNIFSHSDYFCNSFFPYTIKEWNKLDKSILDSNSIYSFRRNLLKMIKPAPNSVFDACDPQGLKLLTRLRLGLSHLRDHKFRHGFNDTIDPFCPCTVEIESISHFFLRCHNFDIQRQNLMNELFSINHSILQYDENTLTELLLYGNKHFSNDINSKIINASINFIKETNRFNEQLF